MSVHHQQTQDPSFCPVDLASAARALEHLRDTQPLVQCITNGVTTQFMANTLLALGATPAMVDIPREAGAFAAVASGLLINTGTPHAEPRAAMIEAVHAANDAGTPWVLDPVAVGTLPVRTPLAKELASLNPTIIRGNASEILALSGGGQGGRGVDSTDTPEAALQAAQELAERTGAVVAISGAVDLLTDGRRTAVNPYGSHMLTRITGGGCALGAVLAAFCHENEDPLDAAVSAHAIYGIAAEHAALVTQGPGSFAMAFLDALAALDPDMIDSPMLETQAQA